MMLSRGPSLTVQFGNREILSVFFSSFSIEFGCVDVRTRKQRRADRPDWLDLRVIV